MGSKKPSAMTIGEKMGHEVRQFGLIAGYLYVCFGALILYKMAILRGQGIGYAPYGLAAVKALVLAKFILAGHAVRIGDRYKRRRFIHIIAHKSVVFLAMLFILSIVEEAVAAVLHGRTVAASFAEVAGGTLPQILATCLIMLLILVPYMTFRELSEVLGEGRLRQILFDYRVGSQSGG
jgi:phosphatidylserine synthase